MADNQLRIMIFGAHPDDCDLCFGATAMKYSALGHKVKFISMTNGNTGHFSMGGGSLARRRYDEAQAAAQVAGVEYEIWDIPNGELMADLATRWQTVKRIREYRPDMVACHRSNDYHPDHRAVGQLVQDSMYTIGIPNIMPLTEPLRKAPVLTYLNDSFTEPFPYRVDIAVDIDDVFDRLVEMLSCHVSQFFEWLAWDRGELDEVPEDESGRKEWLAEQMRTRYGTQADRGREKLVELYGEEHGSQVKHAQLLMISEYGRQPTAEELAALVPFLP